MSKLEYGEHPLVSELIGLTSRMQSMAGDSPYPYIEGADDLNQLFSADDIADPEGLMFKQYTAMSMYKHYLERRIKLCLV